MTLQFIEDILKTLPVGYYLGNRAEVIFEPSGASYCNPMDATIHISGQNVLDGLRHMKTPKPENTETYTRTILYHEISHLILTPKFNKFPAWLNIFEDERIETLLKDYYLDVNFKQFCFDSNGWTPDKQPKDAEEFFFFIVRFRQGPEEFLKRTKTLIRKYKYINSTFDPSSSTATKFSNDIKKFWEDVCDYWNKNQQQNQQNQQNQQQDQQQNQNSNGQQSSDQNSNGQQDQQQSQQGSSQSSDSNGNDTQDGDQQGSQQNSSGSSQQSEKSQKDNTSTNESGSQNSSDGSTDKDSGNEPNESADGQDSGEMTEEEAAEAIEKAIKSAFRNQDDSSVKLTKDAVQEISRKMLDTYLDKGMLAEFHRILIKNNKKRTQHSPLSNGYTGRVDPKSIISRNDYRWFVRKGNNGANLFNRTHITLWVDTSGSFSLDIDNVNKLIYSLAQLEKKLSGEFSFDVVSMGYSNEIVSKKVPLEANGCNRFGPDVERICKKLHKSGWDHYDVMVWDGDLFSGFYDSWSDCYAKYRKAFELFNNTRTVIVSDTDNENVLRVGCPKSRIEFIKSNYAENFINTVVKLLERTMA